MSIQDSLNIQGFNLQVLSESFFFKYKSTIFVLFDSLKPETQNDAHLKIAQSAWFVNCAICFQEAGKTKRKGGKKDCFHKRKEKKTPTIKGASLISTLHTDLIRSHQLKPGQCLRVQSTA